MMLLLFSPNLEVISEKQRSSGQNATIFSGFWSDLKKKKSSQSTSWFYPEMADFCF